jgi:hypothetical protein
MVSRPSVKYAVASIPRPVIGIAGASLRNSLILYDAYRELCAGLLAAAVIARIRDQSNFYHWWK